ncbi:hypothetical protein [Marinobacterium sp. xm-v-233]|uniref:hypothetical protein n=1 Tax=Marinobacterium sp. xm-v-233 TaxID=2497744 RepID=UPI0015692C0D|nr:hypothetical protein [Marinobacterium sp. xm-v-233]
MDNGILSDGIYGGFLVQNGVFKDINGHERVANITWLDLSIRERVLAAEKNFAQWRDLIAGMEITEFSGIARSATFRFEIQHKSDSK